MCSDQWEVGEPDKTRQEDLKKVQEAKKVYNACLLNQWWLIFFIQMLKVCCEEKGCGVPSILYFVPELQSMSRWEGWSTPGIV